MKIRTIMALCVIEATAILLLGCGKQVTNANGEIVTEMGQFIPINKECYYDDVDLGHKQYIVYDKDTMVMYVLDYRGGSGGSAMSPYYVVNSEGEAVVGIYNNDKADE